ncbi:MAG TPA: glycosyltransferase [Bacteroidales bacterium]|nr:glycosyltransferase [Bacteroidales bacterium]
MAKILILGSAHPLRGGGLATFNERMARAFIEEGHQVDIYTFSLQYPGFLFPGKSQYSDEPAPDDLSIKIKVNSINPFNWIKVGMEIKKLRPDILVIRYWIPFMAPCLGTIAFLAKRNRHTRVVAIADNIVPHEKRPADKLLTRFFVKKVHGFVVMSDSVKTDLARFKIPENRVVFSPHPLYDNFGSPVSRQKAREQLNIDPATNLVLFFGFIREYKGLDLLIRAFAKEQVRSLPVKLLVAGEFYINSENYYELARELGLKERIIWHTHFIPDERVREYFCAANLVAQPYKRATQSGVTQIAYHFEIPMLVTNVGGLPEMVAHLKAGYVVNPDPIEIADSLADYFSKGLEPEFSKFIAGEKKRFSWKNLIDAVVSVASKKSKKYYGT